VPSPSSQQDAGTAPTTPSGTKPDEPEEKAAANGNYVIRLGAFADPGRAKDYLAKVKSANVPGYTEAIQTSQGVRTRVRAGPFSSMQTAEKAKEQLRASKLLPGSDAKIVRKGE
jgi:DedD protein